MYLVIASVAFCALVCTGCGGDKAPADASGAPTAKEGLLDLAALLKDVAELKKSPPSRQSDLQQYDAVYLSATLAITRGEVVYVWGAGLSGGTAVVAHEKEAPTAGGFVLLQDGTVKKLTAAEFAAAPKAAAKK